MLNFHTLQIFFMFFYLANCLQFEVRVLRNGMNFVSLRSKNISKIYMC